MKKKIRFAVWNICGPIGRPSKKTSGIPQWEQRVRKILFGGKDGKNQEEPPADFVFLQEIPKPSNTKLERTEFFSKSENTRFYDWHSATSDQNYWRGILFFQKNRSSSLSFKPYETPFNYIGQSYSIYDGKTEILRFIGFWNVLQIEGGNTSTLQQNDFDNETQDYLSLLKKFLTAAVPDNAPCIIAGDTNVCISSEGAVKMDKTVCEKIRSDLKNFLNLRCLRLIDGELDDYTHFFKRKSKFRCDLLMASPCLADRLTDLSIGAPEKYMNWPGGSDHSPLFFSYSYNLPEEER